MPDSAIDLRFHARLVLSRTCRYRPLSDRPLEDPLEVRGRTTQRDRDTPHRYRWVFAEGSNRWTRPIPASQSPSTPSLRPRRTSACALQRLDTEMGRDHALAPRHLHTDGAELLFDYARSHGDKQLRLLTVVRSGQRVLHDVIDQYLKRIEYDGRRAVRVALPITDEPLLVADPTRSFGQAIFIHGAARLADVIGRIEAGEDEQLVAEDFGVPLEDVRAALASPIRAAA